LDIFSLAIVVSVTIFIAAGVYAGRSVKKLDDYFVAGRQAPTLLIVGTLVASVFSTSIFLGEAGFTYDGQLGPYILMPGVGQILPDGSVDLASGEAIMAMLTAPLYIIMGLIVAKVVRRRYSPIV
jgi:hypothetical protein